MDNNFKTLKEYAEKRLLHVQSAMQDDFTETTIEWLKGQAEAYSDILTMANRING